MGLFSILKEKAPPGNSIALEEPSAPTGRAKSAFFPNTGVPGRHARFAELRDEQSDEYDVSLIHSSARDQQHCNSHSSKCLDRTKIRQLLLTVKVISTEVYLLQHALTAIISALIQ